MSLPQGFTLVELLVVITIIAVLSTIGALVYETSVSAGNDSKRIQDILQIQKALEGFYSVNNSYPPFINLTGPNTVGSFFQGGSAPCDPSQASCPSGSGGAGYSYTACPGGGPYTQYYLCAKLDNCGNKCTNKTNLLNDCATGVGVKASGNTYFCVNQASN